MDHKKDIGTLFKQKLDDAAMEPNAELWDKIEVSLDKRDRKRRSFFFFWVGTGTAAIIFFLLYLNNATSDDQDLNQEIPKIEITTESLGELPITSELNSEKSNTQMIVDTIKGDGLSISGTSALNDLNTTENNSVLTKRSSSNQKKKMNEKDPFIDDSVTIKTTYYYYNGATKQMLETTNKNVIDSLLERTKINIDSLKVVETKIINPKKGDSLHGPN